MVIAVVRSQKVVWKYTNVSVNGFLREKRHQYDAVAKRTRGTPYRPNRGLPASSYSVPQPPRIRRTRVDREDENIGNDIDTKDSMYLSPSDRAGGRNYRNGSTERPATTGSATKMAQCPFLQMFNKKTRSI